MTCGATGWGTPPTCNEGKYTERPNKVYILLTSGVWKGRIAYVCGCIYEKIPMYAVLENNTALSDLKWVMSPWLQTALLTIWSKNTVHLPTVFLFKPILNSYNFFITQYLRWTWPQATCSLLWAFVRFLCTFENFCLNVSFLCKGLSKYYMTQLWQEVTYLLMRLVMCLYHYLQFHTFNHIKRPFQGVRMLQRSQMDK